MGELGRRLIPRFGDWSFVHRLSRTAARERRAVQSGKVNSLHDAAASWGHVATTRQLLSTGLRPHDLTRAVRDGTLVRLRQGRYATVDATPGQRAAVSIGGRLTCGSAAASYGLWSGHDRQVHVAVSRNGSRLAPVNPSHAPVRIHWQTISPTSECWRVCLEDCLRAVVRCSDAETAVATLDTAIGTGLVDKSAIGRIFRDEPPRLVLIASRARPGSDSGVESIARQRLESRGLRVRQQIALPGVGRVDMAVEDRLFVEIDGYEFHSSPHDFARDRRRDAAFVLGGHQRLRFTAVDVLREWRRVEHTILRALELG